MPLREKINEQFNQALKNKNKSLISTFRLILTAIRERDIANRTAGKKNEVNDYEILNSAVSSYSPSIYYKKINHFINKGFKFDQAFVFLDVSDIFDELFIKIDDEGNIIRPSK